MSLIAAVPLALPAPVAQAAQQAHAAVAANTAFWTKLVDTGGNLAVNLLIATLILVVTVWLSGWAGRLTGRAIRRLNQHHGGDTTLATFGGAVARNAVLIIGLIAVLQRLGVQTTSIIAVLGAASLAVGLALQGALSNVAAGVMILLFRPYRVGDIIETQGRTGRVRVLDPFVTELETLDGLKVVIPNGKLFGDVVTNHSFHPLRRADVIFRLKMDADAPNALTRLRERARQDPRVLKDPPPLMEVVSLNQDGVEIASRPWVCSPDYAAVKADQLLCARLLATDPQAELPPLPDAAAGAAAPLRAEPRSRRARNPRPSTSSG